MWDMSNIIEKEKCVPSYAILSHTWLSQANGSVAEVTHQDLQTRFLEFKRGSGYKEAGWAKLKSFCRLAREDGFAWAWMDTCCIDKTNAIDTQESINAMFYWYQNAAICYAYLYEARDADIEDCRWFTRGWTLQELLAPSFLQFVGKGWKKIGTRESLAKTIEEITGISEQDVQNHRECSIAKKFSWSAKRKTTEVEDEAYCLLGLFGVHMPLIYGEGRHAFIRFQQELIKISDDETILAWSKGTSRTSGSVYYYSGFLAPSIQCFNGLSNFVKGQSRGFFLTNRGLQLNDRAYWIPTTNPSSRIPRFLELGCKYVIDGENKMPVAILVHQASSSNEEEFRTSFSGTLAIGSDPRPDPDKEMEWNILYKDLSTDDIPKS